MTMKKVDQPPTDPKPPKKFAQAVVSILYACVHCGQEIGEPDTYTLNDENKHEVFIDAQEGVCPKCEKPAESKPYSITAPADPA